MRILLRPAMLNALSLHAHFRLPRVLRMKKKLCRSLPAYVSLPMSAAMQTCRRSRAESEALTCAHVRFNYVAAADYHNRQLRFRSPPVRASP